MSRYRTASAVLGYLLIVSVWLGCAASPSPDARTESNPTQRATEDTSTSVVALAEGTQEEPPPGEIQERAVMRMAPGPVGGVMAPPPLGNAPPPTAVPTTTFYVVSYGGKCLDFGAPPQVSGAPVFIYGCNGTIAQQVIVQEINDRHEVILHAGTKVIGVKGFASLSPVFSRGAAPIVLDHRSEPAPFTPPTQSVVPPPVVSPPPAPLTEAPMAHLPAQAFVSPTMQGQLELQDERNPAMVPSPGQVFALDGDSIILAADRTHVVQVQNNRGADRTPLVLGPRYLADAEFWTFEAADKSGSYPTRGFVRVAQESDWPKAMNAMDPIKNNPWGTVIDIDPGVSINLRDSYTPPDVPPVPAEDPYSHFLTWNHSHVKIPAGVTIRGNRRGTLPGPVLSMPMTLTGTMLEIVGNDVRITGLRLEGPSRSTDPKVQTGFGVAPKTGTKVPTYMPIEVNGIFAPDTYSRAIIDHNEMSGWTIAAVLATGEWNQPYFCQPWPLGRQPNVRVARNLIHYNQKDNLGYGVMTGANGYPLIEGNTFNFNRHAIAGSPEPRAGYRAWYNLVLAGSPDYHIIGGYEQDFDMHGSDPGSHHTGGIGGGAVEIARNTFLGTNRRNFDLRGVPCAQDQFHDNISLQNKEDAIRWYIPNPPAPPRSSAPLTYQFSPPFDPPPWLVISNYAQFGVRPNPTDHLGVGDFDGDGREDLFLATGAAWYYAPAGIAEWRFLNAQTDGIGSLLFGDFDGDGRTDVFTQHGRDWLVSWAGASPWEKINESDARMSEFAIGDFDGDHRADVFYARGDQWFISYGGVGPFTPAAQSGSHVQDLGFGDFNGDGKTDVVGATSGQWMVSLSATGPWTGFPLRPALTNTMAGLRIADFNGDGRADIATVTVTSNGLTTTTNWRVSYDGRADWGPLRTVSGAPAAIGRFDATRGADMLFWNVDQHFHIVSSGSAALVQYSRGDMR